MLDDTPLVLRGYTLHMVLAEKPVMAVQRGTSNTRRRDFADPLAARSATGPWIRRR